MPPHPTALPRHVHAGALLVSALVSLSACGPGRPREFRVGLLGMHTGAMAPVSGIPAQQGARIAVDELNAGGGIMIDGRRHRVVLIERSIESRPDDAATRARALINLDSVDVIIGPQVSSYAIAAATVAEVSGVPLISPMASNPAVTMGRRLVFRLAFVDAFQGELLARYAFDSLGLRRAAVLHDAASAYGRDITHLFRQTFEERGGTVVGVETFDTDGGNDFGRQLRRLIAERPDAILLPNYAVHDSMQVRQARALGFKGRFLGSDSWDPIAMSRIPSALGSVVVANWDRRVTRPAARAFIARYNELYQGPPRTTAAATYDAIRLAAAAAERAGTRDGSRIAEALRTFGEWDGASASFIFRGSGDPVRGGVILEVVATGDSLRFIAPPRP